MSCEKEIGRDVKSCVKFTHSVPFSERTVNPMNSLVEEDEFFRSRKLVNFFGFNQVFRVRRALIEIRGSG